MQHRLAEWWNRISLRTKITGVTVLLLILGLAVAGVGTMTVLRNYLLAEEDARIGGAIAAINPDTCQLSLSPNDFYIGIVDHDGNLQCDNRGPDQARPMVGSLTLDEVSKLEGAITVPSTLVGGQWRVISKFVNLKNDPDQYTAIVGLDLSATNSIVSRYAAIFLFFGLTVVILGGALTRLLVTSTFTPLRDTEVTAARFAGGDFSQRIAGPTPNTEVGRLNRSLNAMLNRV